MTMQASGTRCGGCQILEPRPQMRFDDHTARFLRRTAATLGGALLALALMLGVAVSDDPNLGKEPLPQPWELPLVHYHPASPEALPVTSTV